MEKKWFTPAEGMTIPDPHTLRSCPPKGMWVGVHDEYWQRRAEDGGGVLTDSEPEGEAEGSAEPEGGEADGPSS